MSFSAGIRALEAKVKRLEAAAGKGRKCAVCRLHLRTVWLDPWGPPPEPRTGETIRSKCEFCGTEHTVSLASLPEEEREAHRLHASLTLEDVYTNPKAHALMLWFRHRPERKEVNARRVEGGKKAKDEQKARSLAKLEDEASELFTRKHEMLTAKYGEPFPEQARLIESVQSKKRGERNPRCHVEGLSDLEREETQHIIRAGLEKIIWGVVRAETASAIERLGKQIGQLIASAE